MDSYAKTARLDTGRDRRRVYWALQPTCGVQERTGCDWWRLACRRRRRSDRPALMLSHERPTIGVEFNWILIICSIFGLTTASELHKLARLAVLTTTRDSHSLRTPSTKLRKPPLVGSLGSLGFLGSLYHRQPHTGARAL